MKRRVFEIVEADVRGLLLSKVFDIIIISLITINVILIILETFSFSAARQNLFATVQVVSVIIFTIEIILRVYRADMLEKYKKLPTGKARLRYFVSPM